MHSEKQGNGRNSVSGAHIKKIRPICFLQLLKLKKIQWFYFFDLRPRSRVMAVPIVVVYNISVLFRT